MDELQTLIHRVREAGCRITQQRVVILQALSELNGHASAEKVHGRVMQYRQDVDLSTVYRTLEMLRDRRILSQTNLGRGCAEFEIMTDQPHHHLICLSCGKVIDLDHAYLAPAADAIRRDLGFSPVFDHFAVFGTCEECRLASARLDVCPQA
jgi:Fur family ferric uptake transcriptional regulator